MNAFPLKPAWASVLFIISLWIIKSAESLWSFSLSNWGVFPGDWSSLAGILFMPFIHGSWDHLASNTLPLVLLASLLNYGYPKTQWRVIAVVWMVSGLGVWLLGRESYHIGASGLTHGLFYFLFLAAILRRDKRSIALMMVAVFMFGSMVLSVLPWDPQISFEGHLFGAVGGVASALLWFRVDSKPQVIQYEWEQEPVDEFEEPYWIPENQRGSFSSETVTSQSIKHHNKSI